MLLILLDITIAKILKRKKRILLFSDVLPIIPAEIRTNEQLFIVLFIIPLSLFILVLLFNIFILGNGINTLINIILIVLSGILLTGYILGRRYLKNHK